MVRSTQKWNAFQHGNLVHIKVFLILLAPARKRIAVEAKAGVASGIRS